MPETFPYGFPLKAPFVSGITEWDLDSSLLE